MASDQGGARWRLKISGPVSRSLVRWLEQLVPILRQAPEGTRVVVEIETEDPPDDDE